MFCKQCGKEIPDGTKFCNYCGAQQIGGQPQAQKQAAAPQAQRQPAPQRPAHVTTPKPEGGSNNATIISCTVIVLLIAVIAVLLILFKDYLFGAKETKIEEIENEVVSSETIADDAEDDIMASSEASEPEESSDGFSVFEGETEPPVAPENPDGTAPAPVQPTGDFDPAFWQRDYYGVLHITNATGEKYHDGIDDFFMRVHPNNDNLSMWNLYTGPTETVLHAKYHLDKGGGPKGRLYTTETWFSGNTSLSFDVDPATGLSAQCENLVCLSGYFADDEGTFNFTFYMKPWGDKNWDDVTAVNPSAKPRYCEQIYFPLMDQQKPMPRSFEEYR